MSCQSLVKTRLRLHLLIFCAFSFLAYFILTNVRLVVARKKIYHQTLHNGIGEFIAGNTGYSSRGPGGPVNTSLPALSTDVPWLSHPSLKRGVSSEQYREHICLLEAFDDVMRRENITYILCDGTLLGSFLMHDMIPWDDDLDVMVARRDMAKTINVFREIAKQGTYQAMNYQAKNTDFENLDKSVTFSEGKTHKFKFYRTSSKHAGKYGWRWPFVDIKFFEENDTHIWPVDYARRIYHVPKKSFFPPHVRPFGRLWLPAPRDTRRFLQIKFKQFKCKSSKWNHEKERVQKAVEVPCDTIYQYYPIVERLATEDGRGSTEILKLDDKVLHSVFVDEPYYSKKGRLEL